MKINNMLLHAVAARESNAEAAGLVPTGRPVSQLVFSFSNKIA
jgi:hypothetical protein